MLCPLEHKAFAPLPPALARRRVAHEYNEGALARHKCFMIIVSLIFALQTSASLRLSYVYLLVLLYIRDLCTQSCILSERKPHLSMRAPDLLSGRNYTSQVLSRPLSPSNARRSASGRIIRFSSVYSFCSLVVIRIEVHTRYSKVGARE